jgi:hypothetical protein
MEIYIVTELNILASGEKEIYVTPFEFIADAEKEKERLTEEHIDEGYRKTQSTDTKDIYMDDYGNFYEISIKSEYLLKSF